jgi:hypothetical protein
MAVLASPDVGVHRLALLKNHNNASPVADSPWRARTVLTLGSRKE